MLQTPIKTAFENPAWVALLGAGATLGGAYGFQFAGYHPCDLCWLQRYPYMAVIGLAAFMLATRRAQNPYLLGLMGAGFWTTAGLGIFHSGVEQKWWQSFMQCSGGGFDTSLSTADLLEQIKNAPLIRCDEIAWSFLGLSMASWNAIIAGVLGGFMLVSAYKRLGSRPATEGA